MRNVIICVLNGHNFVARQSRSRKEDKVQSGGRRKKKMKRTELLLEGKIEGQGKWTKENKTKGILIGIPLRRCPMDSS